MTAVHPTDNQQTSEQTKSVSHYCKKRGHVIRDCRERMRKEKEQKNDPSIQTRNHRLLIHLHHVLIANEQTILQKNVGVVPSQQKDPNGLNKSIQQIIEMMGRKKET